MPTPCGFVVKIHPDGEVIWDQNFGKGKLTMHMKMDETAQLTISWVPGPPAAIPSEKLRHACTGAKLCLCTGLGPSSYRAAKCARVG